MTTILETLHAEILERQEKIKQIQGECSHPLSARTTENKGNTGNWDRDDSYWTEHECGLCGLKWHTDQGWDNQRHANYNRGMPGWKRPK